MSKITAIVVAAGRGLRMGGPSPKQYLSLGEHPVFMHTLMAMEKSEMIDQMILVVGASDIAMVQKTVGLDGLSKLAAIVPGGQDRNQSVFNGLERLSQDCSLVVVHDGVRPFFTLEALKRAITAARVVGAAVVGVPVKDTIKLGDENSMVVSTPPRDKLWAIQTPQVFRKDWLLEAHKKAKEDNFQATDDASLLEWLGKPVQIVMGDYENIKLTTPEDLDLAEAIWQRRQKECG